MAELINTSDLLGELIVFAVTLDEYENIELVGASEVWNF